MLAFIILNRSNRGHGKVIRSFCFLSANIYILLGLIGYLYYGLSDQNIIGFYNIGAIKEDVELGISLFFLCGAFILFGGCLYRLKPISSHKTSNNPIFNKNYAIIRKKESSLRKALILFSCAVPLFLSVIGSGFDNVISSTVYLPDGDYPIISRLGGILSMAAIFFMGMVVASENSRRWKIIYWVLLACYLSFYMAIATRRVAMLFVLYFAGSLINGRNNARVTRTFLIITLAVPFLLYLPLYIRSQPLLGLAALPANIYNGIASILSISLLELYKGIFANISFGVPLAGYVAVQPEIKFDYLLISISPLPSFLLGAMGFNDWYAVSDDLRVNAYIPYSAIGELANHGLVWLFIVFSCFGYLISRFEALINYNKKPFYEIGYILACGLLFFSIFISTQYNLRSVFRFYYYSILVATLWPAVIFFIRGCFRKL